MSTDNPVDNYIAKMAEKKYPAPPKDKEYMYTSKYLLKREGYSAGAKDIVKEHLGGFAEWVEDNYIKDRSTGKWFYYMNDKEDEDTVFYTTDQLIEKYFEEVLKTQTP